MLRKKVLIILTASLGALGAYQLVSGSVPVGVLYTAITTLLLSAASVGGLIQYTSREMQDFREVYREKAKMAKSREEALTEALILKEKEILILQANLNETSKGKASETRAGGISINSLCDE